MSALQPVHCLVEAHAASAPARVALAFGGATIAIGALNARANQLARVLRAQGVGSGTRVAALLGRTPWWPTGLLAVLKAGGTWLPLDPEHPDAHLAALLGDAGATFALTERALAGRLPHGVTALVVDALRDAIASEPDGDLSPPPLSDLACVMPTSGSTGRPRHVGVSHEALAARFVLSPYRRYLAADDTLAAITAASWMPSVFELLLPLACGARVALADQRTYRDPPRLAVFLAAHRPRFVRAAPSLWRALLDAGYAGHDALVVGTHGEALDAALEARLARIGREVCNTFGATEGTVFAQIENTPDGPRTAPVDHPLGRLWLRDADGGAVAPGEVGEIVVEGAVVAHGYVGDAASTAACFADTPRGRAYRTGDLARREPGGALTLLGRADRQVKIRGQRVALSGVERAAASCPGVEEVAVVARAGADGAQRLVAYVVGSTAGSDLRAWLTDRLPAHHVPQQVVPLPALPRNRNGKVDRAALPEPPAAQPSEPPATDTERAVAALWAEHLGLAAVGRDDDFRDLGGHSLIATRIAVHLHASLGVALPLDAFFGEATPRVLAARIDAALAGGARDPLPPIDRVDDRTDAPASPGQERLFFVHRLRPDDASYHLPLARRIRGPLEVHAVRGGLRDLIARHEALRTAFSIDASGRVRQHVRSEVVVELSVDDLSGADDPVVAARRLLDDDTARPFDVHRAPLLRARLLRLGPDDHVLFVCTHHLVSDGWSQAILRHELGRLIDVRRGGAACDLPPLPVQVVDHAAWQRARLDGAALDEQLAWWRANLDGLSPTALPPDRPGSYEGPTRAGRVEVTLPPERLEALRDLGRAHGASLYMVLVAALDAVLHRLTGERDLCVLTPVAGRAHPATEPLIGFFVNMLPIRVSVDREASFAALLVAVRRAALDALAHQDVPFERVVAAVNPTRDDGRAALSRVALAVQNTPRGELRLDGLQVAPFPFRDETTRLDVELHAWERDEGLVLHLLYDAERFADWRMATLLRQLDESLDAAARAPDTPVAALPPLTVSARARILDEWNDTARPLPETTVPARCAATAAASPEHVAIVDGAIRRTHAALDRRANQLAHALVAHGVGPGVRVGVALGRSAAFVEAVLAIWRCGAAYVPLDPLFPAARLAAMIADAEVRHVVAPADFEAVPGVGIIAPEPPQGAPERPPVVTVAPDEVAYVMFTSGSTGRPKGVEVTHRGVLNLALYHIDEHGHGPEDRASVVASPSFDASVLEVWPILMAAGSLHIPSDEVRRDPGALVAWLAAQRITVAFLPTPLAHVALDAGLAQVRTLRTVHVGGDRLLRALPPGASFRLINEYGPTETTVMSTFLDVAPGDDRPAIGRPIPNTRVYVVDPDGALAPVGVPGELWIAGVGVARGYVGQPALTAARFVDDPFGPGRAYRTGDRAMWRPDGTLTYLGRFDDQVKLRGVRIEPGEIDAVLVAHEGVREAVTLLRDDGAGPRLVSYVVPTSGDDAALEDGLVARWNALYDDTYGEVGDPGFDTTGWNSSFTGAPYPPDAMRGWVDATVDAIRALRPARVLELGCGTGLLLHPLVSEVDRYVATDLSAAAVDKVRAQVRDLAVPRARVSLHVAAADDVGVVGDERFDTVILNSVAQYFPSLRYLDRVLDAAIDRVAPGGRLFVGDVRRLDLLRAFHLDLALHHAAPGLRCDALRADVAARVRGDKELVVDPAYFARLRARHPRVSAVSVHPKRGVVDTEMSRYRVDVVIHLDEVPHEVGAVPEAFVDRDALDARLRDGDAVWVRGMVDARVARAVAAARALDAAEGPHAAARWAGALPDPPGAVELEALHALAAARGRALEVHAGPDGALEALFTALDVPGPRGVAHPDWGVASPPDGARLGTDPLHGLRIEALRPALRGHLAAHLAEIQLPAALVFLDALPIRPNGKLDRSALAAPPPPRPDLAPGYTAPATPTERAVADAFAAALGLQAVGRDDHFFALGGHSLIAVQVANQLHDALGVDVPLSRIFADPTPAAIARWLDAAAPAPSRASEPRDLRDADVVPLTATDLAFHYGNQFISGSDGAWYQVVEIVADPLDLDRLRDAIHYTVNRHPLARGRISALDTFGPRVFWDARARHATAPLEVHTARDEAAIVALRERVVTTPFRLDEAPLVRFVLIRGPGVDHLLIRYHHGAADASGMRALTGSLFARYAGAPEPARRILPFTTDELLEHYGHGRTPMRDNNEIVHLTGLLERLMPVRRPRWLDTSLRRPREIATGRLAPDGGVAGDRRLIRAAHVFSPDETARLRAAARGRATTLDRLFLVGVLEGATAWNAARQRRPGRLETYWAVNLRPPRFMADIVANQFAWSRVRVPTSGGWDAWRAELLDPSSDFLLRGALDWIQAIERFDAIRMPDGVRRAVLQAVRSVNPSMMVSHIDQPEAYARGETAAAFGVRSTTLYSRFAETDRPVIVIGRTHEGLRLGMVAPAHLFDQRGADRFVAALCEATLAVADGRGARVRG